MSECKCSLDMTPTIATPEPRCADGIVSNQSSLWGEVMSPLSTMTMLVLALVIEEPTYRRELARIYMRRCQVIVPAGEKAIYNALDRLQEQGWVQRSAEDADGQEPRRAVCKATADGVAAHKRWLLAPDDEEDKDWHTTLIAKISTAERLWASQILELIDRYERHLINELQRIEQQRREAAGAPLTQRLVLDEQRLRAVGQRAWVKAARLQINGVG
jgi:DNA-binding PadR family transcriptional regulator